MTLYNIEYITHPHPYRWLGAVPLPLPSGEGWGPRRVTVGVVDDGGPIGLTYVCYPDEHHSTVCCINDIAKTSPPFGLN